MSKYNLPPLMSPLDRMPEPLKLEVQAYAIAAIEKDRAERQSVPSGYVRFCPECGTTGEVRSTARDCCPDGSHAAYMPEKTAKVCSKLFHDLLAAAPQPQPLQEPVAPVGTVTRYLGNDGYMKWAFQPEAAAWLIPRDLRAAERGAQSCFNVYTSPQAQPLTDEQILSHWAGDTPRPVLGKNKVIAFARATEAAHNITKGTT